MAHRAAGRGSGDGIDRAILEACLGSAGAILEGDVSESGRCKADVGTLPLAQALSNRGRRGRKTDFRDAERLVKRLVSQELVLSFVPDAEQRLWRTLTRTRYQRTRDKVRLQNQLEALLEEAHIKLSSLVSDLLGASARRMLKALADGETDPAALDALAEQRLRATPAQLHDALGACTELNPVYRRLVKLTIEGLQFVEQQIRQFWSRRLRVCSSGTRMQSRGWRSSPGSEWIRRNRLSPKWVPRQRPSPQPKSSPGG